jgi:hypothetical protein
VYIFIHWKLVEDGACNRMMLTSYCPVVFAARRPHTQLICWPKRKTGDQRCPRMLSLRRHFHCACIVSMWRIRRSVWLASVSLSASTSCSHFIASHLADPTQVRSVLKVLHPHIVQIPCGLVFSICSLPVKKHLPFTGMHANVACMHTCTYAAICSYCL